jgi:hypothetical protein
MRSPQLSHLPHLSYLSHLSHLSHLPRYLPHDPAPVWRAALRAGARRCSEKGWARLRGAWLRSVLRVRFVGLGWMVGWRMGWTMGGAK